MHREALEAALAALGHDTTWQSQLNAVGATWFGAGWRGCWACDRLPAVGADGVGVANTGRAPPAGARIGHWVAFMDSGNERCFSDPLGAVGRPQRADLAALYPQAHWSDDDPEMAVSENICGPASLAACAVGHSHGRDAFLRV